METEYPSGRCLPDGSFHNTASDEEILADVPANLIRGIEAVGGRLIVTSRRVVFKPHPVNIQKMPEEILIDDIVEVGNRNTLGLIPNGFFIRTKAGAEHKLVVWDRRKLLELIEPRIGKTI